MSTLRAFGKAFDPDAFLASSSIRACKVYHVGEARHRGKTSVNSGFNAPVSDRDWGILDGQVEDAISFLERNKLELERLVASEGIEGVILDFPLRNYSRPEQTVELSPRLVMLAGTIGIGIDISFYLCSSDDEPT